VANPITENADLAACHAVKSPGKIRMAVLEFAVYFTRLARSARKQGGESTLLINQKQTTASAAVVFLTANGAQN
jgi:hypothetical protein